ncbi:MAG: tRNA (N6-isopentenyl adenosine(37)-C2)-methylthiotransferase MiaB [Firmicutes bacterium]|nr:tRNA (N6-isopentenyl adenosine(37)-C2)-methylthiotransferase MiaB [Bacillota bacterium]
MRKYFIQTFGCQMNEHDSEIIAGMLCEKGMEEAASPDEAQVIIFNTCSVRENADKRFFGTLGQVKKKKKTEPETIVCVCGCMMQQQHIIDTVKEKYPWVDIIFGTHNIHEFPKLLDSVISVRERQIDVWPEGREIVEGLPSRRLFSCKALVNIMYGCNNFCTYCIVPYTRGRERSRKPENVIGEVKDLVADGVREVMLLGQNVNSYRGDGDTDFAELIYRLDEIEGLDRIRFMTSHPKDLSDRLIKAFGECSSLCKNIHLPVQSGSSRVLEMMNRRYDRDRYMELVDKIRETVPQITISSDIMVGFPGETEEDFLDTLDLIERVRYDSAFTFLYSPRKGTPAAEAEDQIPEEIKHDRFNRMVDLINTISAEKNAAMEGKTEDVLVEGISKQKPDNLAGRTDGFKLVNFRGDASLIGKIVPVRITKGKTFSLEGEII